ncbi:MAG: hypothetical protein K6A30_09885 [Lachnospiraceae bacterium]|nr:hypothetical protein [Lachnospiraceae bacterium]
MLPIRLIKEKSKSLKIPYQNLLVGAAKERILDNLQGTFPFYLKRTSQIGLNAYRTGCFKQLYLSIREDVTEQDLKKIFKEHLDNYWMTKEANGYLVKTEVPFDKLSIQIQIMIEYTDEKKAKLTEKKVRLIYENDRSINLICYYPEAELAELFIMLYKDLELLRDVDILEVMYQYAKEYSINGKYLSLYMEEELKALGTEINEKILADIQTTMKNKALGLRYKGYLRSQKRTEPSFETIRALLEKLFGPILTYMIKEEIFFGDWLPELERYL